MLTRTDTALDRPMILFQDIVKILRRSMSTVLLQNTGPGRLCSQAKPVLRRPALQ